jgi:hypothetical protein
MSADLDKRCCGSGVCIISESGECWCGQVWDGEKMSAPKLFSSKPQEHNPNIENDDSQPT